jgi:hypothetical protein
LTFENRGDSDVLKAISDLGKDLKDCIRSVNEKLSTIEEKIVIYEETILNLHVQHQNKVLEKKAADLEQKLGSVGNQNRAYNVIVHDLEDRIHFLNGRSMSYQHGDFTFVSGRVQFI